MAKAIVVEPCFAISGGTIAGNAPVVVRNTKLVGGFDFFEVSKTHCNIQRMLAPLKRGERVLAGTTVIEDLLIEGLMGFTIIVADTSAGISRKVQDNP